MAMVVCFVEGPKRKGGVIRRLGEVKWIQARATAKVLKSQFDMLKTF